MTNETVSTETKALLEHAMTVGQLRAEMVSLPDDMPVIVYGEHGQDGESPASHVEQVWYEPISTWGGELYTIGPDADGETYEPEGRAVRALWIEPIN